MEFVRDINWNFLKIRNVCFILSAALILVSLVSLIAHGGPRYGIDFTGGRVLEISFGANPDIGEVRDMLLRFGFGAVEVQSVTDQPWVMFRVPMELDDKYEDFSKTLLEGLRNTFTAEEGFELEVLSNEKVGPKVGEELRNKALWAILFSLLAMLVYITIRFQFRFGVASVLALFHDAFITLGIFSILNKEITLTIVAALLTIVGYSINDSIVVSDRIRENMTKLRKIGFAELVNKSLNQVFARTIIMAFTTIIVIVCLLLFGSKVIYDFALALLIGMLVGTYSSIYIVSPIVVLWEKWFPKKVAGMGTAR